MGWQAGDGNTSVGPIWPLCSSLLTCSLEKRRYQDFLVTECCSRGTKKCLVQDCQFTFKETEAQGRKVF